MSHRPLRGIVTAALTAGLIVAGTGPAQAETLRVNDPAGDMFGFSMSEEEPLPDEAKPDVSDGDIVRTVFRHTAKRFGVTVKFAQLRRIGEWRIDVLSVITNEGLRRDVTVYAGPGLWTGESEMTRGGGTVVSCPVRHRIDYDTGVVELSFPRSCVSNPRWVRADFGSGWSDGEWGYMDDALTDESPSESVALTPRLRRG